MNSRTPKEAETGKNTNGQNSLRTSLESQTTVRDTTTPLGRKAPEMEADYPKFDDMRRSKILIILLSLSLASLLYAIEQTIVATSVSIIGTAVHAEGSLAWITTSYLLTATAVQPITGRLADAIGIDRFLIIELWVFVIGNIIAGVSKSLPQLIAGRLVAGVGGAGLLSLSIVLLSHLTNERQRGLYLNLINLLFVVAHSIGPLIGGGFAKSGHWEWIFLFNAPFGPIITFVLWKTVKLPRSPYQRKNFLEGIKTLDLGGMFTLVASLTFFVIGINVGGQAKPWDSPLVISMFCAAGVAFVSFVFIENMAREPIVPPKLFTQWRWRNVPLVLALRTLLFFHLFAMAFYLPVFLQVIGVKPIKAAALVIPCLSTSAISSIITSYAAYKWRCIRPFFLISYSVLPVGMGLMSTLDQSATVGKAVGYSILSGIAFGSCNQLMVVVAQVGLPRDELSTVTALVSSVPNLGGVLGVGVAGNIISNTFRKSLSKSAPHAVTLNLNDVVKLFETTNLPAGVSRTDLLDAFIIAWQVGCLVLTGVAVAQFVLSLLLRPVTMDDGKETDKYSSNSPEGIP